MKHRITVFTPTYNRGYIIENLFQSLERQTYRDFEWLVIDDGSVDNTEVLFSKWKSEPRDFTIRYYKVANGGKCRAINKALDYAEGELFFTVDSDDYLTDDALEKVDRWFEDIKNDPGIKGIVANRGFSPNKTVNYCFEEKYLDKTLLDMYTFYRNGKKVFDGERAFIFYTDFHRQYKYPEFEGENFMTEAVTWNRMANDGYKVRFVNDIIWVFEYQDDGLTRSGSSVFLNNPYGYGLWLKELARFQKRSLIEKLKMYYTYTSDMEKQQSLKVISKSIGAPYVLISLIHVYRKMKFMIKR